MKKTLLTLLSVLFCAITFAQSVPQGINYQAVARDASGAVLMNQTLSIQLSVIAASPTGTVSWQETHAITTNDFGLFTAIIGQGTSTGYGFSANFDAVNWGSDNHYIKVEMDGIDMGTTELMSVPYALSAGSVANALWVDNGNELEPNSNVSGDVLVPGDFRTMGSNIDLNGNLNWHGDNAHIHSMMGDIDIMSDMGDVRINSMMGGDFDVDMEQIDMHGWMGINLNGTTNINGTTSINGDVIGSNPPTMPDHLTRKDYVDAGDAALLDSLNALDSVVTANALWSDDGNALEPSPNASQDLQLNGDANINGNTMIGGDLMQTGNYIDLNGSLNWHGDNAHIHSMMGGIDIMTEMGPIMMSSDFVDINAITTNINGELNVSGNLYAGGTLLSSDRRFKKDIITVDNALDKVLKLRGVYYYWRQKDFPNKNFDDKLELGLIAQEVETIIPEVVGESADGYKGVEYSKLVALLVEAIKEQQAIIDGQKTEMADMRVELDGRLKVLEEMFNTATLNK